MLFVVSFLILGCGLDEELVSVNENSICGQNEALFAPEGYLVNHLGGLGLDEYTSQNFYFIDDLIGFQIARTRFEGIYYLLNTEDGGVTWQFVELSNSPSLKQVIFKNANEGSLFTRSSKMYKTIDGGLSWTQTSSQSNLNHYSYDDQGLLYASSFDEIIYVSNNDGESWTVLSNNDAFNFTSTRFSFEIIGDRIYALGKDNSIVVINLDGDHIVTWFSGQDRVLDIHSLNDSTFIFERYDSLSITKDGGESWEAYYDGIAKILAFTSENEAVILMNESFKSVDYIESYDKVAYTADGGTTWIQNENTNLNLLQDYKGSQEMTPDRAVMFLRNCLFEVKRG